MQRVASTFLTRIPLVFLVGCVSKDTPAPAPSTPKAAPLPTLLASREASIAVQARRWSARIAQLLHPLLDLTRDHQDCIEQLPIWIKIALVFGAIAK
jgi:hypothetical protein